MVDKLIINIFSIYKPQTGLSVVEKEVVEVVVPYSVISQLSHLMSVC